jgi:hypothetical protein
MMAALVYFRNEAPIAPHGQAAMLISAPFALYVVSRYLQIALVLDGGGDPVRTLLRARPALRPSWCRATWTLLVAGVGWLMFVLVRPVVGNSRGLGRLYALLPPAGYAIVPVVLLAAVPAVRHIRAPIPVVPRRIIVSLAVIAILVGALEIENPVG